jgi:hypothetical protein
MINKTWYQIAPEAGSNHFVVAAGAHAAHGQGARPEWKFEEKLTAARGKHLWSPQHRQYFL